MTNKQTPQVAIITGASSGIGFATALKLAEMGMAIVGVGRDEARLAHLATTIADPSRVATLAVDVTDDQAPKRIVDLALSRWGRIDFLINNAGVGRPKPLHETDDQTLDFFLNLMLRAPFRLAREAICAHEARLGDRQRELDVRGRRRDAGRGVFGGEGRIDRTDVAHRLPVRSSGIRCNAVAPGWCRRP